ncbi:cyclic nucleotide-binding domain protein [Verrucomicrobiia bacterium DG1235]|nr:cyclic nucleotide-binding domain protein [Verrucomicrobiae bacterium DG1235]
MRQLRDLLLTHPIFHDFPEKYIEAINECAWEQEFLADQYLFWTGQEAKFLYIIRDGTVSLQAYTPEKGPVAIEKLGNGDIIGWSWLFPPYKWHLDAKAESPCHALVLDGRCILGKCADDHELGYELMKRFNCIMLDRLAATRMRLIDVYAKGHLTGSNYDFI